MRLINYIISLFLITFAVALPIELNREAGLAERDFAVQLVERLSDIVTEVDENTLEARATSPLNTALTAFMTQLNTTGTGVTMVEFFATNSLTQSVTINAIIGFLKNNNLTDLLNDLQSSNLAVDVVNEVLSHPEAFSGLVTLGKALYSAGELKKKDTIFKRSLLGDIVSGIGSAVSSIIGGVTSGVSTVGSAITSNTTNPLDPASIVNTTTSIIGGLGSDIANTTSNVLGSVTSTAGQVIGGVTNATSSLIPNLSLPSGLDPTEVAIFTQLLSLIGNSDVESVMESLDQSGLGSSVIYAALTNSQMQAFVVQLVKAIETNNVYTLSELWSALVLTSFLISTATTLLTTTQYRNSLIGFVYYFISHFYLYL